MTAPTIMIQGTTSSAGKSLLATALCRIYSRRGLRVAPFKSQNMSLNSFVTPHGHEIGRAQAVQAQAAGVPPRVEMNPILLKPEGDARSQVVVMGRPMASMGAVEYHEAKPRLKSVIADCLDTLRAENDLVVIEGAGSPAEINLRERDIVNMHVARTADAPVLLVGDIDRGGIFAAFVGTMALLEERDRARVKGFVVNRFRGDVRLLEPGLVQLENLTGLPTMGVLPYVHHLRIADEDSLALQGRPSEAGGASARLVVAVVRLPRLSNFDDVLPLEHEPDVDVLFVTDPRQATGADLLLLPGSKSTLSDLAWLRASGFAELVLQRASAGRPVLGICGGCQMLGRTLEDPDGADGDPGRADGLGLLPLDTRFLQGKTTAQVRARAGLGSVLWSAHDEVAGYEVHSGEMRESSAGRKAFQILSRNGQPASVSDGAVEGSVTGTMIHGLFENESLRSDLLRRLRRRRGLPVDRAPAVAGADSDEDAAYDRWAGVVAEHLDMTAVDALIGLEELPAWQSSGSVVQQA